MVRDLAALLILTLPGDAAPDEGLDALIVKIRAAQFPDPGDKVTSAPQDTVLHLVLYGSSADYIVEELAARLSISHRASRKVVQAELRRLSYSGWHDAWSDAAISPMFADAARLSSYQPGVVRDALRHFQDVKDRTPIEARRIEAGGDIDELRQAIARLPALPTESGRRLVTAAQAADILSPVLPVAIRENPALLCFLSDLQLRGTPGVALLEEAATRYATGHPNQCDRATATDLARTTLTELLFWGYFGHATHLYEALPPVMRADVVVEGNAPMDDRGRAPLWKGGLRRQLAAAFLLENNRALAAELVDGFLSPSAHRGKAASDVHQFLVSFALEKTSDNPFESAAMVSDRTTEAFNVPMAVLAARVVATNSPDLSGLLLEKAAETVDVVGVCLKYAHAGGSRTVTHDAEDQSRERCQKLVEDDLDAVRAELHIDTAGMELARPSLPT